MKKKINNIYFFDLWWVFLYPIHNSIIQKILLKSNNKDSKYFINILNDSFYGTSNYMETIEKISIAYNISANDLERIINEVIQNSIANKEIKNIVLDIIKNKENSLWIISDLSIFWFKYFLHNFSDILHLFSPDKIYISCFTKKTKRKDWKKYFQEILSKYDWYNIYYIDDELENIENSKYFTKKSILFKSFFQDTEYIFEEWNQQLIYFLKNK